jgi:hypothetical protein
MPILNIREQAEAITDVRRMILSSGQTARLLRPEAGDPLYGHDAAVFVETGSVPVELIRTPPPDLPGEIDATASVVPDAVVEAGYWLMAGGETFRIQTVVEERLFGVVTHKALRLVKIHAG